MSDMDNDNMDKLTASFKSSSRSDTVKAWLKVVRYHPVIFGRQAGFTLLDRTYDGRKTNLHNDWLQKILFGKNDLTLQAHRGAYKTTALNVALALMLIIYPKRNIILVRKTDDDVKDTVNSVRKLVQTPMYKDLCRVLYNRDLVLTTSTAYALDTNLNTSASGEPQLLAIGIKSSMVGKHAHYVVTDDIVNIEDRYSKPVREHTALIYEDLSNNIKNRDGRMINFGTPWHVDDAFRVMPKPFKYDCYQTDLISPQELQEIKSRMEPSTFSANYELRHVSSEKALFKNPYITTKEDTPKIYDGIMHVDAAYGGDDYTAVTIAKEDEESGKVYVYGLLRRQHVDNLIPLIEAKRQLYRAGTVYTEANADKGYLSMKLRPPKVTYHENQNKYIKISSYLKGRWEDIIFLPQTDKEYIDQILDYNEHAVHDDAPDSLASLVRVLDRTSSRAGVKDTVDRLKRLGL